MTTHLFTPRHAVSDKRLRFQISTEDLRKTSRGENWSATITDQSTGQRYKVWGADCGAGRCFCDALCIELDEPEALLPE